MSNPDMEGTIMNIAGAYSHAADRATIALVGAWPRGVGVSALLISFRHLRLMWRGRKG